ncbi:hypothetical protein DW899_07570 [Collinsella sp. AM41-2BH]|nr:hypothetical protein DW899_07570 [Collinsella sp. AM41-2BH]
MTFFLPRPDVPAMLWPHSEQIALPDSANAPQSSEARRFFGFTSWAIAKVALSIIWGMPPSTSMPPHE